MNKRIFYLLMAFLLPVMATNIQAQGDITLTIELNAQTVIDPQYSGLTTNPGQPVIPNYYINIYNAIESAGTDNGYDLTDGGADINRVTQVILIGTADYTYFDLRGVRARLPKITTVDMSGAKLKDNKIQSPFAWKADWTTLGGGHTLNGEYGYIETNDVNVELGVFAFSPGTSLITTVYLPNTLVSIGSFAFANCRYLTNLTLPQSLNSIGTSSFVNCTALTIPAGLPATMNGSLGSSAFDQCSNLELTTLPANLGITGDVTYVFRGTKVSFTEINNKINGNDTKRRYYTGLFEGSKVAINAIPEGIYTIAQSAFRNCAEISTITFPLTMGMRISGSNGINSYIGPTAFALPEGSPTQRVYIFEAPNPPLGAAGDGSDGTVESAFYKGSVLDPTAIVYVPNAAAVPVYKAVSPYSAMNVRPYNLPVNVNVGAGSTVTTTYGTISENGGSINVHYGDAITFTFTPAYGYAISSATVGETDATESLVDKGNGIKELSVTNVTAETTVTLGYTQDRYFISFDLGSYGEVTTSATVFQPNVYEVNTEDNATFAFSTSDPLYSVSRVLVDGNAVTLENDSYTFFNVQSNYSVVVECVKSSFEITIDNSVVNGTIESDFEGNLNEVPRGANITFTFTPNPNYQLWSATVDESSITLDENNRFILSNITEDHTISASFFNEGGALKIYVDVENGNDTTGDSWTNAFTSMGKAFNAISTSQPTIIYLKENAIINVAENEPSAISSGKLNVKDNAPEVIIEGNGATLRQANTSKTDAYRMIRDNASPSAILRIRNLTIQGVQANSSNTGAAIFFGGALLEIDNCKFLNNKTAGQTGGAIESRVGASKIVIRNSVFESNQTAGTAYGGAIAHAGGGNESTNPTGGSLIIDNCVFKNNATSSNTVNGSAIAVARVSSSVAAWLSKVQITNSVFFNNGSSNTQKGAVYLAAPNENRSISLTETVVANNTFYGNYIGAIYAESNFYDITMLNNVIVGKLSGTSTGVNSNKTTSDGRRSIKAKNNAIVAVSAISANIAASEFDATNSLKSSATQDDVDALGLASELISPSIGVPYLPIISATSPLIDAGISSYSGVLIPSKDITGATRANGNYSGDYVDIGAYEYPQYYTWTGATDTNWATGNNWNPAQTPATYNNVVIPAISNDAYPVLNGNTEVSNVTLEPGAGIDLSDYTLSAASIKAQTAIAQKKWYSIGFPFAVNKIHSEYYDDDLDAGVNFWMKAYTGTEFTPVANKTTPAPGEGYIIEFPAAFQYPSAISFISGTIEDLEKGELAFSGDYSLQANPSLAPYATNGLSLNQHIYKLNTAGTEYVLADNTTPIAPFEAVITVVTANPAPKISLDTDVITGIVPGVKNDAIVAMHYYNLQGVAVGALRATPLQPGIYIMKTIYASGKSEVSKIIIQ
ncbi:hypothetical protein FACS189413_06400 [Bacteroidia bacterium]|nr:hypothetical protein FACS189413_06400 [Bacteroidia bacterium]